MTPRHLSETRIFADHLTARVIAVLVMLFILYLIIQF